MVGGLYIAELLGAMAAGEKEARMRGLGVAIGLAAVVAVGYADLADGGVELPQVCRHRG